MPRVPISGDCDKDGRGAVSHFQKYTVTSLIIKNPAPKNSPTTLGIGLRCDPRGGWFLMGEVPLYAKIFTLELLSDRCHGCRFRETVIDAEAVSHFTEVQGYLAHKKTPPPPLGPP